MKDRAPRRLTEKELEEAMKVIKASSPEDYDGHIDWDSFSFEKKLEWISRGSRIWQEWGGILREKKEPYGKTPGS